MSSCMNRRRPGSAPGESVSDRLLAELRRPDPPWLPVVLLVVVASLYWATLYPGVGGRLNPGDSAKFQYAGKILGVPHEPGYPQYVMLNHLWTLLPLPMDLATRVNLLSAVFALVAGGFLYDALRRMAGSPWAAALGTASLLLSRTVWLVSTEAEVYSLHLLYVTAVLWAGERWWSSRDDRWLLGLVAIGALSFGNHPLAVTIAAGVLALVLVAEPRTLARPRILASCAVIVAASAGQYLFVLWRSYSGVDLLEGIGTEAGLDDMVRSMTGARFTSEHALSGGWTGVLERLAEMGGMATQQLGVPVLLLAVAGAAFLLVRRRALAAFVVLPGLLAASLVSVYHIGDWQAYLPPVWAALVTLAAIGIRALPGGWPARGLALAAWAVVLVSMVGANRTELRVEDNPWDRGWLLEQASPEDLVVTFLGSGYRENEVHRYYEHGLDADERPPVALGRRVFAGDFAFVHPGRIYLAGAKLATWFRQHDADLLPGRAPGVPPRSFLYTGTRDPVREVEIGPQDAGVTVKVRGQSLIRPPEPIQALVVGAADGRVKGTVRFGWDDPDDDGVHSAAELAARLPSGDWYCVVVQGALPHHRRLVGSLATAWGAGRQRRDARRALVILGRLGDPSGARVLLDPEAPLTVALGGS